MDHSVLDAADAPLARLIDDAIGIDDAVVLVHRLAQELRRFQSVTHSELVLLDGVLAQRWTLTTADDERPVSDWLTEPEATVEGHCAVEGIERRLLVSELRLPVADEETALSDRPLVSPIDSATDELLILPLMSARGSLGSWAVQISHALDDTAVGSRALDGRALDGRAAAELRGIAAVVAMVLEKLAVLGETDERRSRLASVHADLESTNGELETVARMASSELHQPLGQIRNYANRLAGADDQLTERELDYLERIIGASSRMQRLVADLLVFSRVSADEAPMAAVDLNQVVSEVLMDLELTIIDVGGTVSVGDLAVVSGNSTQLRQLFQNLIGNAIKYRKSEAAPLVSVRSVDTPDGSVCIEVEDNGIGFEPQFVDRIFKPFQRLHGRGSFEGSGIGLAVCRRIVERHGGELTARSEPGTGSTFVVTLTRGAY